MTKAPAGFSSHKKIRLREFSKLVYGDPREFLIKLRELERSLDWGQTPQRIRNLRTNKLKEERERRDAALFCVGISKHLRRDVRFAPIESSDYDFVVTWREPGHVGEQRYCPVQLKEVAPSHLNPQSSLQQTIQGLGKYTDAQDLVVAIKLNRQVELNESTLALSKALHLGGIWLFGSVAPDQSQWAIWGDLVEDGLVCDGLRYSYPTR